MTTTDTEILTANLDGHLRAFAMINNTNFDYSSNASIAKLDKNNLIKSLSDHLNSYVEEMRGVFEDIEFSNFMLEKLERIEPWIGPFENDLKKLLLPNPFTQSNKLDSEILETVRKQVAWYIMELLDSLTNGFSNKEIFKINYKKQDGSKGCYYLIPIQEDHLLINFCKNNTNNG